MKTLILTLSMIFSTTLSAGYLEDRANEWTTLNTVLECSMLTVSYVDYRQTMYMSGNNWHTACGKDYSKPHRSFYYKEWNPILGKTPSANKILTFGILSNISIGVIAFVLPNQYREIFQGFCLGIESGNVLRNHSMNISWKRCF